MARQIGFIAVLLLLLGCHANPPVLVPAAVNPTVLRSSNITGSVILLKVPSYTSFPENIVLFRDLPNSMKLCIEDESHEGSISCKVTLKDIRRLNADLLRAERVQ